MRALVERLSMMIVDSLGSLGAGDGGSGGGGGACGGAGIDLFFFFWSGVLTFLGLFFLTFLAFFGLVKRAGPRRSDVDRPNISCVDTAGLDDASLAGSLNVDKGERVSYDRNE